MLLCAALTFYVNQIQVTYALIVGHKFFSDHYRTLIHTHVQIMLFISTLAFSKVCIFSFS